MYATEIWKSADTGTGIEEKNEGLVMAVTEGEN